ncbi:putative enzyme [uncultured Alphaproteobacteria bacterium]|uniref:Putative enzyme n=1 Tax=uncultured Alphaproteobacteria bacterium TaxID=91750 RepID=A0A212KLM5_9PROT|nr:putative enzyme [uncultured Alphaproteobacteria bacterium]
MAKSSRAPHKRRAAPPARPTTLEIAALGAGGDGVAVRDGVRHFVPLALPGETVVAVPRAASADGVACTLSAVERPSPERVAPICPAFGRCGGCSLQHWQGAARARWKRERVVVALGHRGFVDPPVAAVVTCPENTRRRATLALKGGRIGFREGAGHAVVAIDACPVLRPELSALIPPLRAALARLAGDAAVALTWTDTGADVVVRADATLGWEAREALAAFAAAHDLARLAWDFGHGPEPLAVARPPAMTFGGVAVPFPAASFLQPSAEGEAALRDAVLDGLGAAERVADLFCGLGTFALPVARRARRVFAADADGAAVRALAAGVAAAGLGGRVEVAARDLFRDPLSAAELDAFDAVVFDPPRAGAQAQARELAASAVPLVVAVSCNPASFARDARTLADGGYALERVTPVDQFPTNAHVELVAVFRR